MADNVLERLRAALGDRYQVEQQIGAGGMATVYLANDLRHERQVAVKVLHPELSATVGAERFEREIRVAARLQHPHILTLYDSGAAGDLLYYVMPFVQGESLRDRLNRERMLPIDEALRITLEVLDALGHAHALGIVHRDIKPENVLLSGGHALVADFGIARAVSSANTEQKLTQTGTAVGTPLYMSPEQASGDEVGPSSDLYSVACMTYEMLTGAPPFTGANARAIMARHTMDAVPSIITVRETVPDEVEDALMWALNKVSADRPATASQLAEALGTPMGATATRRAPSRMRMTAAGRTANTPRFATRTYDTRPLWRRPAIAAGAVVLLLAAVGAIFGKKYVTGPGRAAPAEGGLDPKNVAVLYFDAESADSNLLTLRDGLTEGLINALSSVSALKVVSRGGAASVKGSGLRLDSIARLLNAGTIVRGDIERDGGDVRVTVRLMDGEADAEISRATFRRPVAEALALRDSLVDGVAHLVRERLGTEIRMRAGRSGTASSEAWVQVQRAERLMRQSDSVAAAGQGEGSERLAAQADSVAARAEALDGDWSTAPATRAAIAYRRSRRLFDPVAARPVIETGLTHVERAIAANAQDADAFELRGNLQYWKYLLGVEPDERRAAALLNRAQADLEKATELNPGQAGAWATLAHLYNHTKTSTDINFAAQRALEADAFLSNADVIMQRLFYSSYDLNNLIPAKDWCDRGTRRFPASDKFVECRMLMMLTRDIPADVPRAWRLNDSLLATTPADQREYQRLHGLAMVAGAIARAGLRDSARAVLARSRATPEIDQSRDLNLLAGYINVLIGDTTAAVEQLGVFLTVNPGRRAAFRDDPGWWYRPIQAHPAFRRLVGAT